MWAKIFSGTKAATEIREAVGFVVLFLFQVSRSIIRKSTSWGVVLLIEQETGHTHISRLENCVCGTHKHTIDFSRGFLCASCKDI